ncbi:HAD family phosphatase [Leifsonia shinshuensis]|uniref:HAD family hydrolase n=1 Tax=Leifsonia shinshuensis TaxID=150026 RepID=UPI001F50A3A4|nr:HAD family phosphatase [Leifsonia shinshuensis]MCI0155392.1 HAD family phosphatase [Leifsonia shinshuensis]
MPAAVLWDMDGTLVDTEPYWMASEQELVRSFGGTWTHDDGLLLVGQGLWNSAAILQSRGVELPADEIVYGLTERVREKLADEGVPWRPGARELLQSLRERGVRTALVTMSVRSMAEQIVAAIPFDAFDVIVSGDEVGEPKPHPEPYLRAAEILGIEPGDAVAIEDSLVGLASAVASGATTIGVPHIVPLPESDEHTLWESLAGRTADDIAAVAAAREEAR